MRSDDRGLLTLPAAADLRERVAQVHGLALARSLLPLDEAGGPVWGLVSPISVSFPTRRYLHVAVNSRVVDMDSFAPTVAKAYADLPPKGRHLPAFLRLALGPGEVDVIDPGHDGWVVSDEPYVAVDVSTETVEKFAKEEGGLIDKAQDKLSGR